MKVRWHLFFILAFLLLVGKISLFATLEIEGSRPDLLLILATYIALSVKSGQAMVAGWCLGVMSDITSGERCAVFAFLYLLSTGFILKFKEELVIDPHLLPMLFTFFLSLQCNFFHALMIFWVYKVDLFLTSFFCAFYTALVTPLVMVFLEKMPLLYRP